MNWLRSKLRKWLGVDDAERFTQGVANRCNRIQNDVNNLRSMVSEHVTVGVDAGLKAPCRVIVVGTFKGYDYVEIFPIDSSDMGNIIDYVRRVRASYPKAPIYLDYPGQVRGQASALRRDWDLE